MASQSARRPARGFTLIELLIVMAIIGMLLALVVPRYFHTVTRARETVLREDLAILREAIDKYYADLNQYPDTLAALLAGGSLHQARRQLDGDPLRGPGSSRNPRPPQRYRSARRRRDAAQLLVTRCPGQIVASAVLPTSACS